MSTCALLAPRSRGTQDVFRKPDTLGHAANWPDEDSDSLQPAFECHDGRSLPRHTDRNVNLPDGLYLGLFNGRDTAFTASPACGFDGPLIGRLRYCHTVEAREIRLEFLDPFEGHRFFPDMEVITGPDGHVPTGRITLPIQPGLSSGAIVFDDRYFADWTVFIISSVRTVIGRDLRSQQRV
ncbi:hypothetical protein F3J20_11930 [Paraburkholderia sp. Cy-641]|uniref:hypothetical protein n=1 Tax=Paraburkholderia sp. Cy-641 TaxID=2608337 RepID=UPI00141E4778|nr:hypothetical protein [Paraburkholderia sp. Cy-641]NIF78097.1 hypothetical protein [Paraburkholderia sp. Cy-641]